MDERLDLVVRHRLLAALRRRFDATLVLIEAGPGFGKTTLLRQALDEPTDVGVDVHHTVRTTGADRAALLDALGGGLGRRLDGAADVREAIWARSPVDVCVVLDDVHLLEPDASDLVVELASSLPGNGHLVLSGRRQPVAVARRLLLDGTAIEIGESDLVFDLDELAAFERLRGRPRDAPPLDRWPALAELEVRVDGEHAIQYLIEEVVDGLGPEIRHAARRAAVHNVVDRELLEALGVTGVGPGDLAAALPLTATVAPDTVEIHDLLRTALVSDLAGDERTSAEASVAAVLRRRGDLVVAVELFARAGRMDDLERIARDLAFDLHVGVATDARRLLLDRLRARLGPSLAVQVSDAVLTLTDQPDRARLLLESAAEAARSAGDTELECVALLRHAEEAYYAADLDRVRSAGRRLTELASAGSPAAERTSFLPGVWDLSLNGRHREIVDQLSGGERRVGTSGRSDPELEQLEAFHRIVHTGYAGHIRSALAAIGGATELPTGVFANRLAGFALVQRWHLGELDADDLATARRLVDHIEQMGQAHLVVEGAATTSLFHASFGDLTTAGDLLERALRHRSRLPDRSWARHTVAQAEAVLHLFDGHDHVAARVLREAMDPIGVDRLPRFVYGLTAPVSYLLVPETRALWDSGPCGPDHEVRRDIAHALVAVRERADGAPAAALPWSTPRRLRPWAFEPLLAELAVAATAAGNDAALDVLAASRHDPRRHVERIASRAPSHLTSQANVALRVLPRPPRDPVHVSVLGPTVVTAGGHSIGADAWARRQRVRDLLLLLVQRRRTTRTELAGLMWPDKPPAGAAGNFRFTLNQLLGVLEPDRPSAAPSWFVRSIGDELRLMTGDRFSVDVDHFRSTLTAARHADRDGKPGRALDHLRSAIASYGGPYLADASSDEWGYLDRIRLQGDFVDAVVRACELLVTAGELAEAETIALSGVEAEPMNERATRALAGVLLARGRVGVARDVVETLLGTLTECGLEPETETAGLAARLRVGRRSTA